jgi:hypothetical protein
MDLGGRMTGPLAGWTYGVTSLATLTMLISGASAQTMGASSSSTGTVLIPVTTTSVGKTTYGSKSLNVVNQGGSPVVPSFSFSLPELPKATQPGQLLQTPKPFEPDLGPFEANR